MDLCVQDMLRILSDAYVTDDTSVREKAFIKYDAKYLFACTRICRGNTYACIDCHLCRYSIMRIDDDVWRLCG